MIYQLFKHLYISLKNLFWMVGEECDSCGQILVHIFTKEKRFWNKQEPNKHWTVKNVVPECLVLTFRVGDRLAVGSPT